MGNIAVIGATGKVGEHLVEKLLFEKIGDKIYCIGRRPKARSKMREIEDSRSDYGLGPRLFVTEDYSAVEDAQIVISCAGAPRKEGQSREELLEMNMKITESITSMVSKHSTNCVYIQVANPVVTNAYVALKVSKFPPEKVIGFAPSLDSVRVRRALGIHLKLSWDAITCFVLGDHGDSMVVPTEYITINGLPLGTFADSLGLNDGILESIIEKTKTDGGRYIKETGQSSYHGPAQQILEMVKAIYYDRGRPMSVVAYLQGEYGFRDIFMGVPAVIDGSGVRQIIEDRNLSEKTREDLRRSAQIIEKNIGIVREYLRLAGAF